MRFVMFFFNRKGFTNAAKWDGIFFNVGNYFSTSSYWVRVVNYYEMDSAVYLNSFGFVYLLTKRLPAIASTHLLIMIRVNLWQAFSACIYVILSGKNIYSVEF